MRRMIGCAWDWSALAGALCLGLDGERSGVGVRPAGQMLCRLQGPLRPGG